MAKGGTNLGPVDLSSYWADQLLADVPLVEASGGQGGTNLGPVDLSSYLADQLLKDLCPGRGIWWPRVELTWVQLI